MIGLNGLLLAPRAGVPGNNDACRQLFSWRLHLEAEGCRLFGGTPASLLALARAIDQAPGSVPLQEPTQVGVLVVDDQAPFRGVALEVIEATPGFESVGEAASGEEALGMVAVRCPELVILDVRMPVMDGIGTARRLNTDHPEAVVVLVSIHDDWRELPETVCCGAKALIRKQDFGPQILRRLWDAHRPPKRGAPAPAR